MEKILTLRLRQAWTVWKSQSVEPVSCKPCSTRERTRFFTGVELRIQCVHSTSNKDFSTHHLLNIILGARDKVLNNTDKNTLLEFTLLKIKPHQYQFLNFKLISYWDNWVGARSVQFCLEIPFYQKYRSINLDLSDVWPTVELSDLEMYIHNQFMNLSIIYRKLIWWLKVESAWTIYQYGVNWHFSFVLCI